MKPRAGAGRTIPRSVRREVFERDGASCTFVDDEGRRCDSRVRLELDHVEPHALGGACDSANLRVRCRAHNRLHAEEVFGRDHVARAIDFRQRKSRRGATEPAADEPATPQASCATLETALRALVSLGFARPDARRALDGVARRRSGDVAPLPMQEVLREAIAALT